MLDIARSSRQRKPVPPAAFALVDNAALKAPLSAEPFLVRGVRASISADADLAARAFVEAQRRDPRSAAAAFFLSDYYFRARQPLNGLREVALLARLAPEGSAPVSRFVAAYARDPANWPRIRALFHIDEDIEDNVLDALAADPTNASAIMAIADGRHRTAESPWLAPLLSSLVGNGEYQRAHAIWAAVARVRPGSSLLYDAGFSTPGPPPPFNWKLASSNLGIAERAPGHSLHVLYYGADDGVVASELLLLKPGTYRLTFRLGPESNHTETLGWAIRCDKVARPLSVVRLDVAAQRGWTFSLSQDCPAQWLELWGKAADLPEQAEATIYKLVLEEATGHAG